MTIKLSTGLANALLSGDDLKATFDPGSEIRIYAGTEPAGADAAAGTLLCTIKNGGSGITFEASASGGVLEKNASETWGGTNAATGTATYYRHVLTADTDGASSTAPRYQGSVGLAGTDMVLGSVSLTSGATTTLASHAVALPIAS